MSRTCDTSGCGKPAIARGRCRTCYERIRRKGLIHTLPTMRATVQVIRDEDGEPIAKVCTGCKRELPLAAFPKHKNCTLGLSPTCRVCASTSAAAHYEANRAAALETMKARYRRVRGHDRRGRRLHERRITRKREHGVQVPARHVAEWIRGGGIEPSLLALRCGVPDRTIRAILAGERDTTTIVVAEAIALELNKLSEFAELDTPAGKDGWNRAGDRYCQMCGTFHRPHFALGFCQPCYRIDVRRRNGSSILGPRKWRAAL